MLKKGFLQQRVKESKRKTKREICYVIAKKKKCNQIGERKKKEKICMKERKRKRDEKIKIRGVQLSNVQTLGRLGMRTAPSALFNDQGELTHFSILRYTRMYARRHQVL